MLDFNSCHIHLTHQIWHSATSTYFVAWRSTFVVQGFAMMIRSSRPRSRISTACLINSIWLELRTFSTDVTNASMWGVFTSKNNIIILPVSVVYHTELQNFLIAPRNALLTPPTPRDTTGHFRRVGCVHWACDSVRCCSSGVDFGR